jgi:DNA repair exonuclease SbcCD ATPase subunit
VAEERQKSWHVQYDPYQPGQSFIRDPGGLKPFDLDRVRVELLLENREVEQLQRAHAEALARQKAEADQARAEQARAMEGLREDAASQSRALEQRLHQLDAQRRELAALLERAQNAERRLDQEYERTFELETAMQHLTQRVEAVTASWSWRVTGPLRAGLKALRGY